MIHILLGPYRGLLFPFTWPGENSARRAVCLPSHRLVGELSHPIELLLHLVFSALTPTGGNIPHYFSQYNGPCSTEAQHKIQSSIFPFPHRKLPTPKTDPTITCMRQLYLSRLLRVPQRWNDYRLTDQSTEQESAAVTVPLYMLFLVVLYDSKLNISGSDKTQQFNVNLGFGQLQWTFWHYFLTSSIYFFFFFLPFCR